MNSDDRKELREAAKGLQAWFKSQEIGPEDAIFVIANLISMQAIRSVDINEPIESVLKLETLPKLIATAVRLELAQNLKEELLENLGKIKDPRIRKLAEEALRGPKNV